MANVTDKPLYPVWAIMLSRLREFIRQPEAVFWVYFFPVLMVVVLGVAFRNDSPEKADVDVVDGPGARLVMGSLADEEGVRLHTQSEAEGLSRLRTGKSSLLIVPPETGLDGVVFHFDPSRPGSQQTRDLVEGRLQVAAGRRDVIEIEDVEFEEPGGRYVDFLVPGLLGMGLMGGGLWGVGFAIVDMRIRKLLKLFMATPMKKSHFLVGMMLSRLVFMIPQVLILLLFSNWIFGVTIYGDWLSLLVVVFFGAFEFAAIGLLVASRARAIESVSGLMNLIMLPMWTLCGIFFSYERFPEMAHPFIRWLPLTPVIDSLRAVMLDGHSVLSLGPELMVMSVWMVATFGLAMLIFRWND